MNAKGWVSWLIQTIQGRPPVTNLYSSAIFIGWGCAGICLIVEWIYANGIAVVAGSVS